MIEAAQQVTAAIFPPKPMGDQGRLNRPRVDHDEVKVAGDVLPGCP